MGVNEWCAYWINFKGYKNWRVVDLVKTNIPSVEEEKVYEVISHGIGEKRNEWILIGTFDTIRTNNEAIK